MKIVFGTIAFVLLLVLSTVCAVSLFNGTAYQIQTKHRRAPIKGTHKIIYRSWSAPIWRLPTPTPPPAPAEIQQFGLVANSDHANAVDSANRVGVRLLRMEFEIGDSATSVASDVNYALAHGVTVIPQAGWGGRIPSSAESANLGTWARALQGKIKYIEFGNETGYSYFGTQGRGAEYAQQFVVAHNSMAGTGVGLLAQADDGNTGSGWVHAMFSAVPNLDDLTAGWTIHPYGPPERYRSRLNNMTSQLASENAATSVPFFVTEWGISTDDGHNLNDNYGWPTNMTYVQAGDAVRTSVHDMLSAYRRIKVFTYFQTHDQRASGAGEREYYFGALKNDRSDKPGLTDDIRGLANAF